MSRDYKTILFGEDDATVTSVSEGHVVQVGRIGLQATYETVRYVFLRCAALTVHFADSQPAQRRWYVEAKVVTKDGQPPHLCNFWSTDPISLVIDTAAHRAVQSCIEARREVLLDTMERMQKTV